MASVLADTSNAFPRSQSSSNIPDLLSLEFKQPATIREDLPRSASYTCLPILESAAYVLQNDPLRDLSPNLISGLSGRADKLDNGVGENGKPTTGADQDERPRIGRTKSFVARPKSWIQRAVKGSPERRDRSDLDSSTDIPPVPTLKGSPDKPRNVSESFATFARKTWISSSRSPSPIRRLRRKDTGDATAGDEEPTPGTFMKSLKSRRSLTNLSHSRKASSDATSNDPPQAKSRNRISIYMKSKLPQTGSTDDVNRNSASTSDSSLPGSLSGDSTSRASTDVPPIPKSFAKDTLASFGIDTSRKKDELWSAFRSLELDFQKFQAKSSALRTNVIRSALLPFIKNYAQHPSNKNLRPEDIDRRVGILNKWWTGLLEMLDGHNNQYVSGIDRPVILEAITGIMTRPEWRLAPSNFAPLADRNPCRSLPRSRSSGSLNSTASQFLVESVYHNVRNMFIQNLLTQMGMVVDKMSLRNAPASLVTFCGKAAAYAFFFCPGVADILIRIWAVPLETIRRVADEFGFVRRFTGKSDVDEIVAEFPSNLSSLGWKSSKALMAQLRQRPNVPLSGLKVAWHGPWVARWCGRDSDLFFVFCKHYHILCEEFLPPDRPLIDKARAPGFALVHAQILTVLDATIHRKSTHDSTAGALSITFEDVLSGADGSAAALPLPPSSNVTRLMAENRLIMLLRDFISERPSDYPNARHTFAEAIGSTLRAAARKTSQFDNHACFIVCDFMEEALAIYLRFQNSLENYVEYIDWSFWLEACQKMLGSQNTMTEIRLFSFIFGAWNMIGSDDRRKEILCFDWLLSEDSFRKYFLHWCPMVRAYYMRLLCWRACRFDEEASQLDIKVYSRVSDSLKMVWSHYLYQKQESEQEHKVLPSIAPCHPAPGRRLLIIRNDNHISSNLFVGFDGLLKTSAGAQETAYKSQSSLTSLVNSSSLDYNVTADSSSNLKKRWSLLGKIMPFSGPDTPTSSADGPGHGQYAPFQPAQKPMSALEQVRHATASARTRTSLASIPKSSSSTSLSESVPSTSTHRPFSFKFSLEWTAAPHYGQNQYHSLSNSVASSITAPQNIRRLAPPRLPAPAHAYLVANVPGTAAEMMAKKPVGPGATYSGRALAEWALIVKECNSFVERRESEGVPGLKLMEVPTLGVEGFRKYIS